MLIVAAVAIVAGIGLAAVASRRAVTAALGITHQLGVPVWLVGITVIAIGTDLPEIGNSVSASVAGHGDVNVGDSIGSVVTQSTVVLALLLVVARRLAADRVLVLRVGLATVGALLLGAALMADGRLDRVEGALLVMTWLATATLLGRRHPPDIPEALTERRTLRADVARTIGWLIVVGGAAAVVVQAFLFVVEETGAPEYVASFLVLALGTSLPELVVDATAIRRGAPALAISGILGASLVDATLSLGIGPLVAPTDVSTATATGNLIVAAAIGATVLVMVARPTHGRSTAVPLVAVYVGVMLLLLR